MAHFLKFTDYHGYVSYMNLDLMTEVDVEHREVTMSDGSTYAFNDDLNDAEWRTLMRYVNQNEI